MLSLSSVIQLPGLLIVGHVPVDLLETGSGALWGNTSNTLTPFLLVVEECGLYYILTFVLLTGRILHLFIIDSDIKHKLSYVLNWESDSYLWPVRRDIIFTVGLTLYDGEESTLHGLRDGVIFSFKSFSRTLKTILVTETMLFWYFAWEFVITRMKSQAKMHTVKILLPPCEFLCPRLKACDPKVSESTQRHDRAQPGYGTGVWNLDNLWLFLVGRSTGSGVLLSVRQFPATSVQQ